MKILFQFLLKWLKAFIPFRQWSGMIYLPRFIYHWNLFQSKSNRQLRFRYSQPCLTDWLPATPFDPHYFYQGAWLARKIVAFTPDLHIDVGSSVLSVSVLSAYVKTIFVDFRPLEAKLSNLDCVAGSILDLSFETNSIKSLSCMHVLEHIGLGRYGDPIGPDDDRQGATELVRVLAPGGNLYFVVPVGHPVICFNAHRIYSADQIMERFTGLDLIDFALVDDDGQYHSTANLEMVSQQEYGCGMFHFRKPLNNG